MDKDFDYSPTRYKQNIDYIGSYCMDGLAMALHCVYYTDSFKTCALKCAKMGGDCDTVGAIAGQIAGAIYGVDS
jgi:ADP-ribosyl-[dinitrogen reductase] hydrolase